MANSVLLETPQIEQSPQKPDPMTEFLVSINLAQYLPICQSQNVTFHFLENASHEELRNLFDMKIGEVVNFKEELKAIKKFKIVGRVKNSQELLSRRNSKIQRVRISDKQLGFGTNAEIYQATWNGIQVAVKKFRAMNMKKYDPKLMKEAVYSMLNLKHPNIVQLIGYCFDPSPYFLVLELMENGHLHAFLQKNSPKQVPWKTKWNFAHQIAEGMKYLHDNGTLHRDLKSFNVWLTKDLIAKLSTFKISDFELNNILPDSGYGGKGSVLWTAPELLEGSKNSKESDVYAFGLVCFELTKHTKPWHDEHIGTAILQVVAGKREEIPKETPAEFANLITQCWDQDPLKRPNMSQILKWIEPNQFNYNSNDKNNNNNNEHITQSNNSKIPIGSNYQIASNYESMTNMTIPKPQDPSEIQLEEFLNSLALGEFLPAFRKQHINFGILKECTRDDFIQLGLSMGQASKLMMALQLVEKFKSENGVEHVRISNKILGIGATSEVFQGTWNNIQVAVKKMKVLSMTASDLKAFKDEAKLISKLKHVNIIQFFGYSLDKEPYILVMELVERGNLHQFLIENPKNQVDWQTKRNLALQIAEGMKYLHDQGILHRDLKSLNVLLTTALNAKISDFGMSKLIETNSNSSKSAFGTTSWMAPELFKRDPSQIATEKTDVYAFGLVCFEMTIHDFPWKNHTVAHVIVSVLAGEREEIPKETPKEFSKLIELCWNQKPELRPTFGNIIELIEKMAF